MPVRGWQRAFLGALLVGALAVAGIALNFTLLRLTQDSHDPVGQAEPASRLRRSDDLDDNDHPGDDHRRQRPGDDA